ncbi:chloramphenicol phosphotransferase CPT family protein [Streptomyces sp. Wb2n-11]|uniref:chloramphenicol phosphotransferase CPT family protein n=1 Tax=Streptomyces sp. Wb2n-11 TaxID=1030533 RepID=UPI000B1E8D5E|nr:chloramphenicol phosphotransferase [Streptomyces sp. Wb2n-11]
MAVRGIVLNGGSSSGKSVIARCLQAVLPETGGIGFGADGQASVGDGFRALDVAWSRGVAEMARAGVRIVVDGVLLGGAASQDRWRTAPDGLGVLWIGVRCESAVAAGREVARGDRVPGTAAAQAELVHRGVVYDLEVGTTRTESLKCARVIAAQA